MVNRLTPCGLLLALLVACGGGDCPATLDGATSTDAGVDAEVDGGLEVDGGAELDGGAEADAGIDAGEEPAFPRPNAAVSEPTLTVIPWNGHASAISFTFDDGLVSQLTHAVPALESRGLRGTFFVTCRATRRRPDEWRTVGLTHELGNHSETHPRASEVTDSAAETSGCDAYIRDELGYDTHTFAYPYGEVGDPYQAYARSTYVGARSTRSGAVGTDESPDWTSLPAVTSGANGVAVSTDDVLARMSNAHTAGQWMSITHHAIEDSDGYAPIPLSELESMLDQAISFEMWIAPYGEVATYARGSRALLDADWSPDGTRRVLSWSAIPGARDLPLRVVIDGGHLEQDGVEIPWNGDEGYYAVDPRATTLTWSPE